MTNSPQLDALIATIEQQRGNLDRETIKQQLIQSGAAPQLVEQALAQVFDRENTPQTTPTSSTAAPQPASVERIRGYLEQHRNTYNREALRRKLIEDGHNPQTIDLAMTQVYGFQVSSTNAPPPTNRTTLALTIVGVFFFNYVLGGILISLTIDSSTFAIFGPLLGLLLVETVAAVALRRRNRTLSRGIAWGLAFTMLPIAALALLFGICIAIIYSNY